MKLRLLAIVATLMVLSTMVFAHAGDITLTITNSKLFTALNTGSEVLPSRVFGSELGEDSPFYSEEPGIEAAAGTFAVGSTLLFDITAPLKVWTGSGYADINTGESLTASHFPSSVTTGSGLVTGFDLPVNADGGLHSHLGFTLNGANSADPAIGIYLLELQFRSSDANITPSDRLWIVLNNGMDEAAHEASVHYQVNAVPEPSSIVMLAMGLPGVMMLRRRKR